MPPPPPKCLLDDKWSCYDLDLLMSTSKQFIVVSNCNGVVIIIIIKR